MEESVEDGVSPLPGKAAGGARQGPQQGRRRQKQGGSRGGDGEDSGSHGGERRERRARRRGRRGGDKSTGGSGGSGGAPLYDLWLYIQMQYCSNNTLRDHLDKREKSRPIDVPHALHVFKQIAQGLE